MLPKALLSAAVACLISGCATMPNVAESYYLPKAETALVVTETLGCDKLATRLISAASAVATTTYGADRTKRETIELSEFGGRLEDADVAINTTPDGRLSGVNATSSGELSSIVKSGVALATATAATGVLGFDQTTPAVNVKAACEEITRLAGAKSSDQSGKLLTLTYSASFSYSADGRTITFEPEENAGPCPSGPPLSATLLPDPDDPVLIGPLSVLNCAFRLEYVPPAGPSSALAIWADANTRDKDGNKTKPPRGFQRLTLNMVGEGGLTIKGPGTSLQPASRPIWTGKVSIPLTDDSHLYDIPIPSGLPFGKQGFALTVADDGAITKLEYSANGGASDALDSGTNLVGLVPTTAAKATAQKDQADLIYQQQRLVTCKLAPKSCPSS
jgi:hypothetical protein